MKPNTIAGIKINVRTKKQRQKELIKTFHSEIFDKNDEAKERFEETLRLMCDLICLPEDQCKSKQLSQKFVKNLKSFGAVCFEIGCKTKTNNSYKNALYERHKTENIQQQPMVVN